MRKRFLSILLSVCMVLTMLPISAMAEEAETSIGTSVDLPEITVTVGTPLKIEALPIYGNPQVDEMLLPSHGFTQPTDGSKTAELYWNSDKTHPITYGDINYAISSTLANEIYFYATEPGTYTFTATFVDDDDIHSNYTITVHVTEGGAAQAQWGVAGSDGSAPTAWTQGTLAEAISYANNLTSGTAYIQLREDANITAALVFAPGKTTILDLNGKDIDRGLSAATADGNVINVIGTLTIKDTSMDEVEKQGRITGGYNSNSTGNTSGGVYVSGVVTLQGGNITGNKTTGWGGGVCTAGGSTFIMQGGGITGNEALGGNCGAVYAQDSFEMTGGSITGNQVNDNGSVFANPLIVGGTAVISGNTVTNTSIVRNVVVYSGYPICLSTRTPLTTGASIGVTANSVITSDNPFNVTGTNSDNYNAYFFSDISSYIIQNGASNEVQLAVSQPVIGTLSISGSFTAGHNLALSELDSCKPLITNKGVTITAQGWQIPISTGGWTNWPDGETLPLDTASTYKLRYYAAYSGGTVHSNEVTLNVVGNTTALTLTATPDGQQVEGSSGTLTATLTGFFAGAGVTGHTITFKNGGTTLGTASLNSGGVAVYTWTPGTGTYSLTAEYAATPYNTAATSSAVNYTVIADPNIAAVAAAKTSLVDGSVNVAFGASQADKTAAVQAYVNALLTGDAAGVTGTVTYNSDTGKYDVAISKGSVNDSKSLSMTVNVAPDPDIAIVAAAKTAAQGASYADMTQTAATDESTIETALKNTAATAVNNGGVTIVINTVSYTAPIAGTSANPGGTNGSYTYTVTVSKGSQSETTGQKTITITATPYTGITDAQAVAAAKTSLVDGSVNVAFGASQADKTAAVQAYVNALLTGDAAGVTGTVTYNSDTGKYDVAISKGSVNDSKSLSMTVNVAPDPDIAIVAAAKTAAQGASYADMTQTAATDESTIETALKNTAATAVNNGGVTIVINTVSYTAPIAGTSANPGGTNGSYTYTVTVSKGSQSETTGQKTITITATPYTGITDAQAVAAAKTSLVDGSVNVAFGASQADKTAAVQAYVNALLTGDAAGVTGTVTYNSDTGKYDVAISKGSVNDSKSLSMTVNVAPDPDIAIVAAAKTAAQGASYADMTQTAATDESTIETALKNTAATAVNNGGVTIVINTVSYTAPIAGTSANPGGTNGSYTYTVTVSKGSQSETTGQKTITITATPYTGGTGGNGNTGGSNGGGSTTPPSTKPTEPVTGSTENKATVDNKGNASVSLTDRNITDAIEDAKAEAAKKGVNAGDITAVIHVTTGGKNADTVTVNLPKTTQEQVIGNKISSVQLVIDRPDLTIGIDLAAVTEINRQAKADVQLSATRMDNSKLSGDAKAAIGNRPAYDLKALYGSGKFVTDFGKGSVIVEIPYTLQKGELAENVYAVYVDEKGKVAYLADSSYDVKRGTVVFSTGHFSTYGVACKSSFNLTDIDGHWAKDDILFVANRGLMTGTSATTFSPKGSMTRGMFVTALGRLANADISAYKKSSFTDVKADAYYMGYIEWGVKNNILVGIGGGKFNPDGLVTREQMAVITDRYATAIGFKLPEVHTQNVFADNSKIGAWAAPSVKRIQTAGIIQGKSKNLYDPQGTATRAEVSAVLRRFVELGIFSDTAQGWTMNDSGNWMYYENGKPVIGKKDIEGSTYTFDQYGVTSDVPKNLRYTTYTVQKGDSFWSIARKLDCTMSELELLNNKSRFSIIFPGDVLRVPEK